VIDYLTPAFSTDKDSAIIYYFFDYSYKESLSVPTFLRSILHQIIRMETLVPNIQRRLEALFDCQAEQWGPDAAELEKLFLELCSKLKKVLLLIDGLDEVDQDNRKVVRNFLRKVQDRTSARIFVTTHPEVDMSTVFSRCRTLKITPQDLETDIKLFVKSQIEKCLPEELSICPPGLLDSIRQALISGAQGMYAERSTTSCD
jgi:hypothetical protein